MPQGVYPEMVQDALLAAYRWLLGGVSWGIRLLPLLVISLLGIGALLVAARRFYPEGAERAREWMARTWPKTLGLGLACVASVAFGGALVQARKLVMARRETIEQASASRREDPSLSGVAQYAPAVAIVEEKSYRRTLTLPPDFLARIGAEGVQVLSPYLTDPSADEVTRLTDEFKRSGSDVVFTREVVRRGETPVAADAAEVSLSFAGRGARVGKRHYDATFEGTYRFRNPRDDAVSMRFNFPLPQGGGTLQEFAIDAAGSHIADPDEKGSYAWNGTVPAHGQIEAHVHYRVTGAGTFDYVLGSERRRIGDFHLVAKTEQPPKFGRVGIFPSRVSAGEAEWRLRDVLTAQSIALVFPQSDVGAETFEKTLWILPAILVLFTLGAMMIAPDAALRPTIAFGFGLLGMPVLSAYAPPVAATVVGAGLAGVLGAFALPRSRILAPVAAVLACAFLTVEHGAAFAWALDLAGVAWWTLRRRA